MDNAGRYVKPFLLFIVLPIVWCIILYHIVDTLFNTIIHPHPVSLAANAARSPEPALSPAGRNESAQTAATPHSSDSASLEPSPPAKIPARSPGPPGIESALPPSAELSGDDDMPSDSAPKGVLMFRGSPGRSYYGAGPLPKKPVIRWKAPVGSYDGWSGTGWTGEPAVVEWTPELARLMFPKGSCPTVEVIVGGLDGSVHFFDGMTGRQCRKPFTPPSRGNIKGSVVIDPDGYPILYFGNRGGAYWAVSLIDYKILGKIPGAVNPRNNANMGYWPDFDGSCLIHDGTLLEGGENGWLYSIPLKRDEIYRHPEKVVPPMKEWKTAYMPDVTELSRQSLALCADGSIETSPCLSGNRIYIGTQHGMLLGFDSKTLSVEFQYCIGDDIDASVVADRKGYLYAGCQVDYNPRRSAVLCKLDPRAPLLDWKKALVWKVSFPASPYKGSNFLDNLDGGILGTPALGPSSDGEEDRRIYVPVATKPASEGILVCIDTATGRRIWQKKYDNHIWSSPAVIDDKVLQCDAAGLMHCHRASDGRECWKLQTGGVIESTPVVWKGWIYVGAKDGYFYAISDPKTTAALQHISKEKQE